MILIDATYINNGGGKVLLDYLVEELEKNKLLTPYYLLDKRIESEYNNIPENRKTIIKPSFISRHSFYVKRGKMFDKIFILSNLPPTIKVDVKVYTYFHNVLFFDIPENYPLKQKISKWIKGNAVKWLANNTTSFWVPSNHVKDLLKNNIKGASIEVLPFYRNIKKGNVERKEGEFCYISNATSHKNHYNLIKAWKIVNQKRPEFQLHLTVTNEYPDLISEIEKAIAEDDVKIINHGWINPSDLYQSCVAQVYPSLRESFGLGLVEAVELGCDVIAPDLPYVEDVITPSGYFDPLDISSIAAAVLSYDRKNNASRSKVNIENELPKMIDKFAEK